MGKLRLSTAVGVVVLAGMCGTAGPALAATSPSGQFCAIVGAAASGPNTASPILGQGCFATKQAQDAFVDSTVATASPFEALTPDSSTDLGYAASGENSSGNILTFFGSSGNCSGSVYYSFSNLTGPFDSAEDDLIDGNCHDAYYWSGSDFDGRDWDCYATDEPYQSCGVRMPSGDDGAAHSVRFRT
jgi:hypothetical protein